MLARSREGAAALMLASAGSEINRRLDRRAPQGDTIADPAGSSERTRAREASMGRKATAKRDRREQRAAGLTPVVKPVGPRDRPVHVTDASFDRVVGRSELPVLVDFWAPWCGPCKAIAPVLDQLAEDFAGRLLVAKYDTQANQRVAGEMNIRSIPTLVVFRDGEVVDVQVGAPPASRLRAWVEKAIAPPTSLLSRVLGR